MTTACIAFDPLGLAVLPTDVEFERAGINGDEVLFAESFVEEGACKIDPLEDEWSSSLFAGVIGEADAVDFVSEAEFDILAESFSFILEFEEVSVTGFDARFELATTG